MQIQFVTDKGQSDRLMAKLLGSSCLMPRSYVIAQWLLTLKALNPAYFDLNVEPINEAAVKARMEDIKKGVIADAKVVDDEHSLQIEKQLGSDVAKNQHMDGEGDTQREWDGVEEEPGVTMRYTHVPQKDSCNLVKEGSDYRHTALGKMAKLKRLDDEEPSPDDPFFPTSLEEFAEIVDDFQTSSREADPLCDFTGGDTNLTTSFPYIFMLGQAYEKCVPNMKLPIREHLLHQFTSVPGQDRRLLGFLFDVMQRFRVIDGVTSYVKSNPQSIDMVRNLLQSRSERLHLRTAIEHPKLKTSKATLHKWMSLFQHIGREIPYSAVEGKQLKHQAIGGTNRYSQNTVFFTLSPNNIGNP